MVKKERKKERKNERKKERKKETKKNIVSFCSILYQSCQDFFKTEKPIEPSLLVRLFVRLFVRSFVRSCQRQNLRLLQKLTEKMTQSPHYCKLVQLKLMMILTFFLNGKLYWDLIILIKV